MPSARSRESDAASRRRWTQSGFDSALDGRTGRNLIGFKDGTNNLDAADAAAMRRNVWVGSGDEPAWIEAAPTSSPAASASGSSAGTRATWTSRRRTSAGARSRARRSAPARSRAGRPGARAAPQPHHAGQPPRRRQRGQADPAPRLLVRRRADTGGSSTPASSSPPSSATRAASSSRSSTGSPARPPRRVPRPHPGRGLRGAPGCRAAGRRRHTALADEGGAGWFFGFWVPERLRNQSGTLTVHGSLFCAHWRTRADGR